MKDKIILALIRIIIKYIDEDNIITLEALEEAEAQQNKWIKPEPW